MTETISLSAACCIVGGGPAGMMLGYLLARAGVGVVVVEKHADFLRDFRGDTVHPSTLQIMHQLGLLDELLTLPHQRAGKLHAEMNGKEVTMADFSRLPVKCRFIAFMPQWDFLNFLASKAAALPDFTLLRSARFEDFLIEDGRICGVRALTPNGPLEIRSPLVVGADGRRSKVREKATLTGCAFGAPRDVLWFRLAKRPDDPAWSMGHTGPKQNFILIDRGDFWQCGLSIAKGDYQAIVNAGLEALKQQIAQVSQFDTGRLAELRDWDEIKLLEIRIDRLDVWAKPGVLCIGDAAHAMSPVGGVGVNLAIQDAVAAANVLTLPLRNNTLTLNDLHKVQRRRDFPTRATQFLQIKMSGKKRRKKSSAMPKLVRRLPFFPHVFGWIIGLGFRRERPRDFNR
nr:FAD-dependent oxidoreductase [Erwinia oleae]